MYSTVKPCSKRVSTLNLPLSTLFRYENSVHSCFFCDCTLGPISLVAMEKTLLEGTLEEMAKLWQNHTPNVFLR